jgi:hypothetical protein
MIKFLNYTIMKKLYFYLLLLPFWGLGTSSAWAQSVQLVGSHFDTGAVTFTVDVGAATPTWVLVEYTTDPSPTSAIMSRATFTNETIIPSDAGTLDAEGRGFLLTSSATLTAKLSGVSGRFSWCGYAFGAPPNAMVNPEGGYTLRGTPPFIVNGVTLADDVKTFGPGTCIESITDFTYNPGGFAEPPAVTVSASEQEVDPGTEVTFTATASGGATNAMTYTWDVAGTTATTTSNTYSQILSTPYEATYTVRVTNANGCTGEWSNPGSICVFSAGTIATATVYTTAGNAPATPTVYPTSIAGCGANIEYQWRRSGASAATLSDSNTPDYDLSLDNTNYAAAGTYYFNRYAKNKAGDWIPAEGTYTLTVDGAIVPPQYARSAQLWTVETSAGTLVWSDNINLPGCTAPTSNSANGCMRTTQGVLYGYTYVQGHLANLCESPWSVATPAQFNATLTAINGGCICRNNDYTSCPATGQVFAAAFIGSYLSGTMECEGSCAWYWFRSSVYYAGSLLKRGGGTCYGERNTQRQKAVRCVRVL